MGPIGITPELKRRGYGKKLLDYCLEKATSLGFGAVLFEGNIGFYGHCGFTYARSFGIRYHDLQSVPAKGEAETPGTDLLNRMVN